MNIRKFIPYIIVAALGILLLNLVATAQLHANTSSQIIDMNGVVMWHIIGVVFAFLFGVLTEWSNVLKLIKKTAYRLFGVVRFRDTFICNQPRSALDIRNALRDKLPVHLWRGRL
jgi:hypothetical protein